MAGAIHGRTVANGPANPIAGMELRWPLGIEEQERLRAAFDRRLASLSGPLDDRALALAVYTAYRAGWADSNEDAAGLRGAEVRREMGEDEATLRDGARVEART
jgi:hypothetical protein